MTCILCYFQTFCNKDDNNVYGCGINIFIKSPYDNDPSTEHLESVTHLMSGIVDAVSTESCVFFLTSEGTVMVAGDSEVMTPFFSTLTEPQNAFVGSTLSIRVITSLFGKEIVKISCSEENGLTLMCLAKGRSYI